MARSTTLLMLLATASIYAVRAEESFRYGYALSPEEEENWQNSDADQKTIESSIASKLEISASLVDTLLAYQENGSWLLLIDFGPFESKETMGAVEARVPQVLSGHQSVAEMSSLRADEVQSLQSSNNPGDNNDDDGLGSGAIVGPCAPSVSPSRAAGDALVTPARRCRFITAGIVVGAIAGTAFLAYAVMAVMGRDKSGNMSTQQGNGSEDFVAPEGQEVELSKPVDVEAGLPVETEEKAGKPKLEKAVSSI